MPYLDAEKKREHDRERMRRVRSGTTAEKRCRTRSVRLKTAEDVRRMLARVLNEVHQEDAETLTKARVTARLAEVLLKALETGDVERRIEALEQALLEERGEAS